MNEQQQRWGILYCPKKGFANQRKRWAKIEEYLNKNDIVFDFIQSENSNSVERLVKMMINNGYKTIVIVGGDSALNDAVNSLMQTEKSVREDVVLGVIPNGIMNDFARFWQLRENDIEYAIETLKKRRVRKIDLGKIKYKNPKGEPCHRYFLNCVNIGLVAAIMNLRRQTRKMLGSRMLSFIFSFILLLFQRLEYMLHIPIAMMEHSNDFYREVKKYLRRNMFKSLGNPYLTKKNKQYIFILGCAPKLARKIHRIKMKGKNKNE